jgi:predicted anti-sigma-YlaC factor YlaD
VSKEKTYKMDCSKFNKLISESANLKLSDDEEQKLINHLEDCTDCNEKHAYLSMIDSILNEFKTAEPRPYLLTRIKAKMDRPVPQTGNLRLVPLYFASVLVIGLIFGVLLGEFTTADINKSAQPYAMNDIFNEYRLEHIEFHILND